MYEFSVEQAANKIHDYRSREYFGEVLNNYFNSNYRSAVVMLWTVVICDLVYKLQYLKDIHNDEKAIAILDEMKDFQAKNPANPNWEINLIKEVHTRTSLLEAHELDALETIQKHRHLSAHPVLSKTDILFTPNREMVLSDIRIALDSVLTKPPILTKQVFMELVEDLEKVKDLFADYDQLKRYLQSKYFSNLNNEVFCQIFKSLWRVTFKTEDKRCDDNREINLRALRILFESNRGLFTEYLKNNSPYFSELSNNSPLRQAIFFLGDYPHLFELLTEATKEIIKAKSNTDIDLLTVSYFLSANISDHIELLVNRINEKHKYSLGGSEIHQAHTKDLRKHASSAGIVERVNRLLVTIYINAASFDAADALFSKHIKPYISTFGEDDILLLIEGIGDNNQTHWRGRASTDHSMVVDRAIEVITSFDVTKYDFLPQPK
jgi:hypothetical protein